MPNLHVEEELLDAIAQHVSVSEQSKQNELGIVQLLDGDFMLVFTTPGQQRVYYVDADGNVKPASSTRIQRALEVL
jgi:hypothetical protein